MPLLKRTNMSRLNYLKMVSTVVTTMITFAILLSGCKANVTKKEEETKNRKKKTYLFFTRNTKNGAKGKAVIWRTNPNGLKENKVLFDGETLFSDGRFSINRRQQKITWSPPATYSSIAAMNLNGSDREIVLPGEPAASTEYLEPIFSPTGKQIVFTAVEWDEPGLIRSQTYIGRINLDKSDLSKFLPNPKNATFASDASFSPDGSKLVLKIDLSEGHSQIVEINSTSGELLRELTAGEFLDSEPTYTPNGQNVVFVSNRGESKNIYIMKVDGTEVNQLTTLKEAKNPAVSPDGSTIAFSSNQDADWEIYSMDLQGKKVKSLTKNKVND